MRSLGADVAAPEIARHGRGETVLHCAAHAGLGSLVLELARSSGESGDPSSTPSERRSSAITSRYETMHAGVQQFQHPFLEEGAVLRPW